MTERTNIYFDFEFIDDGKEIIPISIGMCTDAIALTDTAPAVVAGRSSAGDLMKHEFYQEYAFDPACANDWVRENVFPHLNSHKTETVGAGVERWCVASWIKEWVADVCGDTKPKFVGYYPSYDWVLLCQHFGTMLQTPEGWPMRPECLRQMADLFDVSSVYFPKQPANAHNALADAKWNRELCDSLYKHWEAESSL